MPQFEKMEDTWFREELYPHETMLRSWLSSRFPTISDFEDIIQEAFIRTVKRRRLKPLVAPKAFLFAIARNLCLDTLRRGKVVRFESLVHSESQGISDQVKGIPEKMIDREDYQILTKAIQSLPKKCRRIFTLRKVYGLSLKQISSELGISIKTVEAQISIGIKKSREYFLKLQDEVR
ncbi:MAG: RNA polymerase sigma factor [Verrucomicrobiae bacterium]|nr:RNA polymerase sigma factor [Verrucomicrobiae bacterium]